MDKKPPAPRYATSPVDYEAWHKGYGPPCEHVLIHELSFGGAKVLASSRVVPGTSWWLVMKGDITPEDTLEIMQVIDKALAVTRRKLLKAANSQSPIEEAQRADTESAASDGVCLTPHKINQESDNA
jgi:hypothetical protein